jgi:hypothetical protein
VKGIDVQSFRTEEAGKSKFRVGSSKHWILEKKLCREKKAYGGQNDHDRRLWKTQEILSLHGLRSAIDETLVTVERLWPIYTQI